MKNKYWVRWVQETKDYRPLKFPPNEVVLGWWCSGYTSDNDAYMCALLYANDEESALEQVKIDWPECNHFNAFQQVPMNWRPSDRFEISPWMLERLIKVEQ